MQNNNFSQNIFVSKIIRAFIPFTFFAFIWFVLSNNSGWAFGFYIVIITTITYLYYTTPQLPAIKIHITHLVKFLIFFIIGSFRGGLDVSLRALKPSLPVNTHWHHYPLRLTKSYAKILFANVISLLPGTLSVDLDENIITVHLLNKRASINSELQHWEGLIANLFSLELSNKNYS